MSRFQKHPAQEAPEQSAGLAETLKETSRRHSSRSGAFSAGLTALAVAAVILFNLLIGQLPDTATQFDLTSSGIYNISAVTTEYLDTVTDDVAVHVLANRDTVDSRIVRFLEKYADLSDHLSLEYVDPAVYPSVLTKYGADANTIVVTCAATGRQETVDIGAIIGYDEMAYYYYGTTTETDFDAEGLLTSAVDGVLTDAGRTVYQTAGHGETALPDDVTALFQKVHMTVDSVNLLTDNGIPDDCDLLVLNAPVEDLAEDELTMVLDYLAAGGQVLLSMASQTTMLPNLNSLCAVYGLTVSEGLVMDAQRCYQQNPFLIFPVVDTAADAAAGLAEDAIVLLYASRGMTLTDPARETIAVAPILTSGDGAYAVMEDDSRTAGTYVLGAVATEAVDDNLTARLTVYGTASLVDAGLIQSFTNIDNTDLFLSSATCGFEDISPISVEPVSLATPTNTVATGGLWAMLFIFVLPLAVLVCGFVRWMRRRKL